jgi:hypothetical protein
MGYVSPKTAVSNSNNLIKSLLNLLLATTALPHCSLLPHLALLPHTHTAVYSLYSSPVARRRCHALLPHNRSALNTFKSPPLTLCHCHAAATLLPHAGGREHPSKAELHGQVPHSALTHACCLTLPQTLSQPSWSHWHKPTGSSSSNGRVHHAAPAAAAVAPAAVAPAAAAAAGTLLCSLQT